jgi:hypothetical protein
MTIRSRRRGGPQWASREDREDATRDICFCLLYDFCAWLAGSRQAVPPEVGEYRQEAVRQLTDARQRLRRYLNPALLDLWEDALQPFFEADASITMEVGEVAPLTALGLDAGGEVRSELRFSEQSTLVDRFGGRHPLPRREWALEVWLSPDLRRVENACLRSLPT